MTSPYDRYEQMVVDPDLAYSVDRSWGNVKANVHGEMYPSDGRKMHRPRPGDSALAACSRRILLNTDSERGTPPADLASSTRCRRCFPDSAR